MDGLIELQYLLVDLVKSELESSGFSPVDTLNIITALLYFSRFFNESSLSLRVFNLSSVGIDRWIRKNEFCCATVTRI